MHTEFHQVKGVKEFSQQTGDVWRAVMHTEFLRAG